MSKHCMQKDPGSVMRKNTGPTAGCRYIFNSQAMPVVKVRISSRKLWCILDTIKLDSLRGQSLIQMVLNGIYQVFFCCQRLSSVKQHSTIEITWICMFDAWKKFQRYSRTWCRAKWWWIPWLKVNPAQPMIGNGKFSTIPAPPVYKGGPLRSL